MLALVGKGRETGLHRRDERSGARLGIVVVPVVVAHAGREQQPGVKADGVLREHSGRKLLSAGGNPRGWPRGGEDRFIAEAAHEPRISSAHQRIAAAELARDQQATPGLLRGNMLGAHQQLAVAVRGDGGKSLVVALAGTIAAEPDAGNASRQVQAAVDLPELGIVSLQRCPVVARLVVKSAPGEYVSRRELTARCELAGPMI